jgi:hypothetical protein
MADQVDDTGPAARNRLTRRAAPIRNTMNNTPVATCGAGALASATSGVPRGKRVDVSVMRIAPLV